MNISDSPTQKTPLWPVTVELDPGSILHVTRPSGVNIWLRCSHQHELGWKPLATGEPTGGSTHLTFVEKLLEVAGETPFTLTTSTEAVERSISVNALKGGDLPSDTDSRGHQRRLEELLEFVSSQPADTLLVVTDDAGVVTDAGYLLDNTWLTTFTSEFTHGEQVFLPNS